MTFLVAPFSSSENTREISHKRITFFTRNTVFSLEGRER